MIGTNLGNDCKQEMVFPPTGFPTPDMPADMSPPCDNAATPMR
jgi:hypothetical protein